MRKQTERGVLPMVLLWVVTIMGVVGGRACAEGLVGDYRFAREAPLANAVKGGLPALARNELNPEYPPLLTGQEIPLGGEGAAGNGWALAWTQHVPQVGYAGYIPAGTRIPANEGLDLGDRFTLWMRVLYGGQVRAGGGYHLLTLDGQDGEPVLEWGTTAEETDLALSVRVTGASGEAETRPVKSDPTHIKLLATRWYDLAVAFDRGAVTFSATALGRGGPGETQSQTIVMGEGLKLARTEGPLWILKGTNSAVERLRIYRGQALGAEEIAGLSAGVQLPGPKATEHVEVGTDRQLFIDDAAVERTEGAVARAFHAAEKYPGNPVLAKTQPQEIEGMGPMFWGTVLYDKEEGIFKLWGLGLTFHQPEIINNLYYTSKDGIHWERPVLNIVGPDNRYSPPGYKEGHGGIWLSVRKDPAEADPEQRYKGFIQHNPLYYLTSPDGLHWTERGIAAHFTDDTTMCAYHPGRGEYVRVGRFCADGRSLAIRLIMTCVSNTPLAEGNTPWHLVMLPDEKDLAADPWLQFYHMPAFAYGNTYLGLLGAYHAGPESGLSETELVFSRDGLNWFRVAHGTPFIPRGAPGSWDGGFGTAPTGGPLVMGDELWFYYSQYDGGHHGAYTKGGIGIAKLRRDGFVSLAAGEEGGTVVTKAFKLAGDSVEINAVARGSVAVQVVDPAGKVLAEGEPFTGDDCGHIVKWGKGPDLSALRGKKVALKFLLRDAELFAFQAADRGELEARAQARQSGYLPARDPWETWVDPDKVERVINPNARKGPIEMQGKPAAAFLFDACSAGLVESGDIIDVTAPSSSLPTVVGRLRWTDTGGAESGQGIVFDGSGYLDFGLGTGKELAFSSEGMTVSARVRIEEDGGGAIVSRDSWPDDRGWYLDIVPGGAVRFAVAKSRGEGGFGPTSETGAITPNAFHDVEAVFDRGRIRISVDGRVAVTADYSDAFTSVAAAGEGTPFLIGASIYNGRPSGLFRGTIESLRVYRAVLDHE